MENGNINLVFEELKRIGQCSSRSQFSKEWLGREESYYRSIQSKGLKPSVEAQLNMVSRLRDFGMSFSRSEYPSLVKIGNTYLKLYGECLDALLNSALERGEIRLRRRRINSMRLKEFSTPKSAPKDTNAIKAETIKRHNKTRRPERMTTHRKIPARIPASETRTLRNAGP
jgi:hypothetical protein